MKYHVTMSDGRRLDIEADNAADGIQTALEMSRGNTVVSCYAGNNFGRINYDIPKHEALPINGPQVEIIRTE